MAPYVSPLREAQAAETRRRILDAAAEVFSENGYSGTSLAMIAKQAGVSVETVKQHGPKSALLLAAFGQAFTGQDYETPLSEQPELDFIRALPNEELLAGWLGFIVTANGRVARLRPRGRVASRAAQGVPARGAEVQRNRALDMDSVVALLRDRGMCRSSRPDAELADVISFVLSPESYMQFVVEQGWSEEAFLDWLIEAIERLVLAP